MAEPTAGSWTPWVLRSASELSVPPPPRSNSAAAAADARELDAAIAGRSARQASRVRTLENEPIVEPWLQRAMTLVSQREKNPPAASRAYSLVSVAMHDAAIAAYHWMYRYKRAAPHEDAKVARASDPSYPPADAAIAGAAYRVLAYAYPEVPAARFDGAADDAARLRVLAGTSYPSDMRAGLALGRAVARRVIDRAKRDGASRKWDGKRPHGRGYTAATLAP